MWCGEVNTTEIKGMYQVADQESEYLGIYLMELYAFAFELLVHFMKSRKVVRRKRNRL